MTKIVELKTPEERERIKDNDALRSAASVYEKRAIEGLQTVIQAARRSEPLKASKVLSALASAIEMAEMALQTK